MEECRNEGKKTTAKAARLHEEARPCSLLQVSSFCSADTEVAFEVDDADNVGDKLTDIRAKLLLSSLCVFAPGVYFEHRRT